MRQQSLGFIRSVNCRVVWGWVPAANLLPGGLLVGQNETLTVVDSASQSTREKEMGTGRCVPFYVVAVLYFS